MIRGRAGNTAPYFTGTEPPDSFSDLLAEQSPPVRFHAAIERRVLKQSGCPLYGMDFGDQGSIDEAGLLKELLVRPGGISAGQRLANRIVF